MKPTQVEFSGGSSNQIPAWCKLTGENSSQYDWDVCSKRERERERETKYLNKSVKSPFEWNHQEIIRTSVNSGKVNNT